MCKEIPHEETRLFSTITEFSILWGKEEKCSISKISDFRTQLIPKLLPSKEMEHEETRLKRA